MTMGSLTIPKPITLDCSFVDAQGQPVTKAVVLRKLTLGAFATLTQTLDDLLAQGFIVYKAGVSTEDGAKMLFEMLKKSPAKLGLIVSLVSDVKESEAQHMEVESVIALLGAAWTLNNLIKLFTAALKKAKGLEAVE
jgi:hypothetical protein